MRSNQDTTGKQRSPTRPFDAKGIRAGFPILKQEVRGKPLVYLDNAASAQKPQVVIDTLGRFYSTSYANIHRGIHWLSERATEAYESARADIQHFVGAAEANEIVFVRGTTEAINLVAQTYGRTHVRAGDEILISTMEHHSNIVPWQMLCEATGAVLRVAPINDDGELLLDEFEKLLTPRTKLTAIAHVSNVLGTINPIRRIVELAHSHNVPVLVDGAQAVPHLAVNVQTLDCDFYAFSGHKLFGPTGIGVLYGKAALLETMPPYQGGGHMIQSVTFEKTTYNKVPDRFEAGTPHIAGVVGLGAAVDYVKAIGLDAITAYERELLTYATDRISRMAGVRLIGTAKEKAGVISFVVDGVHPHDLGTFLDNEGIAIRAGHHCAQPLMSRCGVPATARASLAFYNTQEDIDALAAAIHKSIEFFR
ncbi:MAG: cysteine desulfurase [Nitrospira sp.]|nr:cysteine desulfurase [Nitrospira sp.]